MMYTKQFKTDFQTMLGRGSYGEVFLGYNRESGDKVAIKRIDNDGEGEFFNCSMEKELEILNNLCKHENIVQFLDFHKDDDYLYFVMEYCNGLDLGHYLSENTLDTRTELRILCECSSAVNFMHTQHIVHRDIKPSNVLIKQSEDGQEISVKISDFGLAKVFQPNEQCEFMNSDLGLGSMSFRAPELFSRGEVQYTPSIDVFSLGLVYLHVIGYREKLDSICEGFIGYGMALAFHTDLNIQILPLFEASELSEDTSHKDWPDSQFKSLISRMTKQSYEERPTMEEVQRELDLLKQQYEEKYPELELDPENDDKKCLLKQSLADWQLLDIPDESPTDRQCTQWKPTDITSVLPGDHICWWCEQDVYSWIKTPYWRHGIVAEKNDSVFIVIGWKFYTKDHTYSPEILQEEIDFCKTKLIQRACYKDSYYSPEETIDRARLHIGDKDYNRITNCARDFPKWCKTGYGGQTFIPPERRLPVWETVNVKDVQVGDHVCWWTWPKGVYWRHAIVSKPWTEGQITVIGWQFKPKCEIFEAVVTFKESKHLHRARHHKVSCYGVKEIVTRARSRIGQTDYNILTNYARAFPRWCVTGYGGVFT